MSVIVDDHDALVLYNPTVPAHSNVSSGWLQEGTQTEFTKTTSSSVTPGETATFTFTGSSVTVFGTLGPPPNLGNASSMLFSIDQGTPSAFIAPAIDNTTHHELIWTSGPLAEESHTLVITQNSPIRQIFLDYFLYNTTSSTEGKTVFIDDSDAPVQYLGDWAPQSNEEYFQHTAHLCETPGCSASLAFEGTSVTLQGQVSSGPGCNVSVVIDGAPPVFIVTPPPPPSSVKNSSPFNNQLFTTSSPLLPGNHTITFTTLNAAPFSVDYFLVGNDPSITGSTSTTAGSSLPQSYPTVTNGPSPIHGASTSTVIAAAVGGALGGLVLLALILAALLFWRRRTKRLNRAAADEEDSEKSFQPHRPQLPGWTGRPHSVASVATLIDDTRPQPGDELSKIARPLSGYIYYDNNRAGGEFGSSP
ncbi:hypothetical protein DFH07DRAFT_858305 [Mycena maculata]|uniref:Uncharacterized protein n=1 Tax=Mycena maculata TaxID=230809 RepID=A0AAD7HHG6_9AGAR|nr:hypothetical protein DFH07DRAFT_858305 [Mycena maculata]